MSLESNQLIYIFLSIQYCSLILKINLYTRMWSNILNKIKNILNTFVLKIHLYNNESINYQSAFMWHYFPNNFEMKYKYITKIQSYCALNLIIISNDRILNTFGMKYIEINIYSMFCVPLICQEITLCWRKILP